MATELNKSSKKQNILFLSRTSGFGGGQKTLLQVIKSLNKKVINPVLVMPDKTGIFYREAQRYNIETMIVNMPFLQVTYNPFKWIIFIIKMIHINMLFFSIIKKLDIEMVVCNLFQESFYVGFAARLLRKKMIIYIKGILDKRWKKIIRAKVCDFFASLIIAVSKKAKDDVAPYLKNKDKAIVIYEGIEEDFLDAEFDKKEFLKNYPEFNFDENDFIVLNIGNISMLKGQHMLLESASAAQLKNRNIKYIFLGEVLFKKDKKYNNYLSKLVKENNLKDKVFFMGYKENVKEFLLFSDILVHCPNLDDCFPMVILEGLSLAKPVIATRVGGIPEMIEDGVNGYLCSVDKAELAEKILYVYENRNSLGNIKGNALRTVRDNFILEKQIIKTKSVYYGLLGLNYPD